MKIVALFSWFWLCLALVGFAQAANPDSLIAALQSSRPDTNRLKLLSDIVFYTANNRPALAQTYAEEQLKLAKKVNLPRFTANAYNDLAIVYYYQSNFAQALEMNAEALRIRQQLGDPGLIISSLNKLALIYQEQGNYTQAATHQFAILKLSEQLQNQAYVGITCNNLAAVFEKMKRYPESAAYARRALNIALTLHDQQQEAVAYSNLGYALEKTGHLDSAIANYQLASTLYQKTNDLYLLAAVYNNLGHAYRLQHNSAKGMQYYQKAYALATELGNNTDQAYYAANIAQILLDQGRLPEAYTHLSTARLQATPQNKELQKMVYAALNKYFTLTNRPDSALAYLTLYRDMLDTLYSADAARQIAELQTQYETEKKEQQIALLNQQTVIQRLSIGRKNILLAVLTGLFALTGIIAVLFHRQRKLKEEARFRNELIRQQDLAARAVLEAEENERKRIAADLHDGLGQLFSAVKMNLSGLGNQVAFPDTEARHNYEKTVALVDESCREVRSISHQMAPNVLLKAGLVSAVRDFVTKIDTSRLKINLDTEGLNTRLDPNTETVMYRVIQESVNNVIKHAAASELHIQLLRDSDGLSVMVEDNGIGFPAQEAEAAAGMGLKNMRTRIGYLKGSVDIDSAPGRGTLVSIWVPLSEN